MKVVIATDSFKGTLTAEEAARAMAEGVRMAVPDAEIVSSPVGDGGEGTAATLKRVVPGSREMFATVTGPMQQPVRASYVLLNDSSQTVVLDMASAAGLLLVPESDRDPMFANTYGVGELIRSAAQNAGKRRIIVGLGGSATNDCGAGCLQALGFGLLDATGQPLPEPLLPVDLARIARMNDSGVPDSILHLEITLACDVDNPLTGPLGSSRIFGPQKGADAEMVELLDGLLAHFGAVLDDWARRRSSVDGYVPVSVRPGAGAAGGLGAALMALFRQAEVRSGIDLVLDYTGFDGLLSGADLVLTGEGRADRQTLGGKAVLGVLRRARAVNVPVIAIAGSAEYGAVAELKRQGLANIVTLTSLAGSIEDAIADAGKWTKEATWKALMDSGFAA